MENNELYHFGIHGMKWGVRRYQNEDGSRTEEGKIHYGYKFTRPGIEDVAPKTKRQIRLEKKAEKKAAKEEKKRQKHEEEKRRVIERGTAEEVMRFSKELTTEQKNEAVRRLQADSQLINMANQEAERNARIAEKKSAWNKAKRITQKVGDASTMIENTVKLYNTSAKIINSFSDSKWPIVGETPKQKTRSMQLAKQLTDEYGDYSYNQWKNMSEDDLTKLQNMNSRIAQLATAEKLASGSGGKKK